MNLLKKKSDQHLNVSSPAKLMLPQRCLLAHFEVTLDFSHDESTCP